MKAFLHSISEDVGNYVLVEYKHPTKPTSTTNPSPIPKENNEFSESEKKLLHANNKALNAIFTSVGKSEFKRISTCKTAYDAW